ncbi:MULTISPECIES: site-specific DNA-methyltransferase [unclassified Psychrobacter]|uniref:DNA-methyltransferase n=1 Tax=unclassified Psychrobacter TaxID=196806 RepID=UPI002B1BCFE3|nr:MULTISPECIES: site-specific DNA-methyltransferase [unclassified Psychrobacter]
MEQSLFFQNEKSNFSLLKGDCLQVIPALDKKFDMVFADPPYFLSNDGLTVKNGKIQSVNKGTWDKLVSDNDAYAFTYEWLSAVREKMADNATIWVSGTHHNIFTLGRILPQLGFKILNVITWEKTNPPPNFSCRFFTHSTEFIIWARKSAKIPHYFDYHLMKRLNNDKQMKDVWRLPAVAAWEKSCGKHPTQKPLALLAQIILASTKPNALILDPFTGGSTTGIAAQVLGRRFIGIDKEIEYLTLSKNRYLDLQAQGKKQLFKQNFYRLLNVPSPTSQHPHPASAAQ